MAVVTARGILACSVLVDNAVIRWPILEIRVCMPNVLNRMRLSRDITLTAASSADGQNFNQEKLLSEERSNGVISFCYQKHVNEYVKSIASNTFGCSESA